MSTAYPIHPAAMLFPMMNDEELLVLAVDIEKNGLLESIVLHEGQILDGRNRQAACDMVGVTPTFVDANSHAPSPTSYVISKNLHRRHLTTSQRGAIAADAVPLFEDEARLRQLSTLKNQPRSSSPPIGGNEDSVISGRSAELAAKELGVGQTTVRRALTVKRLSPELFEKVKAGKVSAWTASESLPIPAKVVPDGPKKTIKNGKYLRQTGEAQKTKMVTALSTITGLCRGLDEMNTELVLSVCSNDDQTLWASRARELANKLRKFAVRLERRTDAECSQVGENG